METSTQAYWHSEYQEFKNHLVDSTANQNYKQYAKRAFHRARRRHDKQVIENQVNELAEEEDLLNQIFKTDINRYCFY